MSHRWWNNQISLVNTPIDNPCVISIHNCGNGRESREISQFSAVVSNLHLDIVNGGYSDGTFFASCICDKHDARYLVAKFKLQPSVSLVRYNRALCTTADVVREACIIYPFEHLKNGHHSMLVLKHGCVEL